VPEPAAGRRSGPLENGDFVGAVWAGVWDATEGLRPPIIAHIIAGSGMRSYMKARGPRRLYDSAFDVAKEDYDPFFPETANRISPAMRSMFLTGLVFGCNPLRGW